MKRNIIEIDEEKCNGCGECITSCAEAALQIVNGKAKLIKDIYCDGLGACIGNCPTGALRVTQREAPAFDEKATENHVKTMRHKDEQPCGCPGSAVMEFKSRSSSGPAVTTVEQSELTNWPIQLKLVPVNAPYFNNADILIAADCTAFSTAHFHDRFIKGKKVIIACPKLDDSAYYLDKMTQILSGNAVKSVTVARMEVPCCGGLTHIVQEAVKGSNKSIPYKEIIIGIKGDVKKL